MRASRQALVAMALALTAGCGGSSGQQSLTPSSTPTTTSPATVGPSATSTISRATATAAATPSRASLAPSPAMTSAVPTTSPAPGVAVVTDTDTGRTVRLRPHQRLEVRLSQDSYDPPQASSAQVLARRSSTGGYPGSAPVMAVFEALTAGRADVSTSSDYTCFHSSPRCMRPSRLWVVHVIVG